MAIVMSARFDAITKDVAQAREVLDIDCRLTRLKSNSSPLAK
jgi:hypothetical protein